MRVIAILVLLISFLSITFSEIIVGDNVVSFTATIKFNVEERYEVPRVTKMLLSTGISFAILAGLLRFMDIDIDFSTKGILKILATIMLVLILSSTLSLFI